MNTLVKKLSLISAIALAIGTVKAEDSFLYWMVSPQNTIDFSYATVKVDGSADYLYMYDGAVRLDDYRLGAESGGKSTGAAYFGIFTAQDDMSFIFELWSDAETVGRTTLSYADLNAAIYTGTRLAGAKPHAVYGFTPVPEPTGGMLVLLGIAGLALRRKKMSA